MTDPSSPDTTSDAQTPGSSADLIALPSVSAVAKMIDHSLLRSERSSPQRRDIP